MKSLSLVISDDVLAIGGGVSWMLSGQYEQPGCGDVTISHSSSASKELSDQDDRSGLLPVACCR